MNTRRSIEPKRIPLGIGTIFGFLMLLGTGVLHAQVSNSASGLLQPLDNTGGSARAAAMGSAFVAVADDSSALLWNPAGLGELQQGEIGLHHNSWLVDTLQESLAASMPLGNREGIGAMVSYLDYGTFPGRDALGNITSNYTANKMGFMLGYGRQWVPGLSVGLALRGGLQSALGYSYSLFSGDLGLLYQLDPQMRVGAVLADLGGNQSGAWVASVFRFGASYKPKWDGPHGLLVDFDGTLEFQGVNRMGLGVEYSYQSKYFLRTGFQIYEQENQIMGLQELTAGAGIRVDSFQLDYAYLPYGDLGTSNRVSLSYLFPASQDKPRPTPSPMPAVSKPAEPPLGFTPELGAGTNKNPLTVQFDLPPDPVAQGQSLEDQGHLEEAMRSYQEEILKDPQDAVAWAALGKSYFKLGQKADAIRCYEQVLKLKPDQKAVADWLERYKAAK